MSRRLMDKQRCDECGAFVNKDGSHRKDTFTECSKRRKKTAGSLGGIDNKYTSSTSQGKHSTNGWENINHG